MKFLDKKGLIKSIYCMMAVNGEITEEELAKFDELGMEISADLYKEGKETFIKDCNDYLSEYLDYEFFGDVVMECVDRIIEESEESGRLSSRFVIWNLFAIAYSDGSIDDKEKRLIGHISRVIGMKRSVFTELEMLMKASIELMNTSKWLQNSNKPYNEIKPLVDEIEEREKIIKKAVTALINDEVYEFRVYGKVKEPKEKSEVAKKIEETTAKISDTTGNVVANVKHGFNQNVVPVASEVGGIISSGFQSAVGAIGDKLSKPSSESGKEEA